jgi:hypothetical protein
MDKHYGWQEGRGAQWQGRPQNGQRWSERYRDDAGGMSGADFDREEYRSEDEEYGSQSRGGFSSSGPGRWSQGGYNPRQSSGQFANRGFSGGHYGGFANEGSPGQGNYGGNRGVSNQGPTGQRLGVRAQSSGGSYQGRGFAGRGPKGYQRSDERVKEQLSDRLMDDDDIDASDISIEVRNGEVTFTGTVNSREEKRAAEEVAEQSPGVREVQNLLRVGSRNTERE